MGVTYEALRELEKYVNDKYKTGTFPVKVSFSSRCRHPMLVLPGKRTLPASFL